MNKFIVYKASGGLCHMLSGLIYAVELSLKYNRHLILDVEQHSAFKTNFNRFFYLKDLEYFEDYSIIPKNTKYKNMSFDEFTSCNCFEYLPNGGTKFNNKFIIDPIKDIQNNEDIALYYGCGKCRWELMSKYIRINSYVREKISKYKINDQYIGVHFRNTDIKTDINSMFNKINIALDNNKNIKTIYLATDDYYSIDIFKKKFCNNYNIIHFTTPIKIPSDGKNIHYSNNNKEQLHTNILIDMFTLIHSNIFIGSKSGVSNWINYIRNNNLYKHTFNF